MSNKNDKLRDNATKNADTPAMPQTWVPDFGNKPPETAQGLTKREHFAAMAMQGMLANRKAHHDIAAVMAENAVSAADWLLYELERRK